MPERAESIFASGAQPLRFNAPERTPWLYSITIFLSAFLLFLVQPMVARRILPWFGGANSVWTTCMLFFQALLLGGYFYSHKLITVRGGGVWHILLLGWGAAMAPLLWLVRAPEGGSPILAVLQTLIVAAGVPYIVLSSTGPLIQAWFARRYPSTPPYGLFALSNTGSLLGLLAYPLLIEPWIGVEMQLRVWAAGFAVFAVCCGWIAWQARNLRPAFSETVGKLSSAVREAPEHPWVSYIVLPALSSALLLAVTNHLTQNIAPIPFLWVLPLTIYLLTFILCFDRRELYSPALFHPLTMVALGGMVWTTLQMDPESTVRLAIPVFSGGLFVVCMFCHGELARRKPEAAQLTRFYLMLSVGGATGALLVAVGAPYLLKGIFELPIVLTVCAMVALFLNYRKHWVTDLLWTATAVGVLVGASLHILAISAGNLHMSRNFYGAIRVTESGGARHMIHGTVRHGIQFLEEARRLQPTAYYGRQSGIGQLLLQKPSPRVGVIGLGVGTLAVYARPGDEYTFYELDPQVVECAQRDFTFLSSSKGRIRLITGDGRLSVERETSRRFDVLAVDAFSGDSIPVHLITREAFQLYRRRLKADGVLAIHISNSSLDLSPVAAGLAQDMGRPSYLVADPGSSGQHTTASYWALIPMNDEKMPGTLMKNSAPCVSGPMITAICCASCGTDRTAGNGKLGGLNIRTEAPIVTGATRGSPWAGRMRRGAGTG
ncbi:MAG: fused MFS/spermidine synthase [Acidobacteriia bacterium]|nr:fused MFS/spermidine synthase [Terriglobia bacterium]